MNRMHYVVIFAVLACSQFQINADTDGDGRENNTDFIICGVNETYKEEFFNQDTKMRTDFNYFEKYEYGRRCEENNICKIVTKMTYGQEKLGTRYVDSVERTCKCKETMKCVKSETDTEISPNPPDDEMIAEYYRCQFSVCTDQNRYCYIVAHVNPVLNITYCHCNGQCIFKGPRTENGVLHHYYQCFPEPTTSLDVRDSLLA